MKPSLALLAAVCLLPQVALANQLDRLQVATEASMAEVASFMLGRIPALAGKMPSSEWAAEDRVIGGCVLASLTAEQGDATAEAYVAAMEVWSQVQITSMMQMAEAMPAQLAEPYMLDIGLACGQVDRAAELMEASGVMAIIQDPANLELLMAESRLGRPAPERNLTKDRLLLCLAPILACADQVERYEAAIETLVTSTFAFFVSRVPELEGNLPQLDWDDIDRDIGRCVLRTYASEAGEEGVESLLAQMEAVAAMEITSYRTIEEAMKPIRTNDLANRASVFCGQDARTNELMARTRMAEIISNPDNVARLTAD